MALSPWHGSQREGLSLSLELGEPGIGGDLGVNLLLTMPPACHGHFLPPQPLLLATPGSRGEQVPGKTPALLLWGKELHVWAPSPPMPLLLCGLRLLEGRARKPWALCLLLPPAVEAPGPSPPSMADSATAPETPGVPGASPIRHGLAQPSLSGCPNKGVHETKHWANKERNPGLHPTSHLRRQMFLRQVKE